MIYRDALEERLKIISRDHPQTLMSRHNMAWMIGRQGRYREAETMLMEVLTDRKRVHGRGTRSADGPYRITPTAQKTGTRQDRVQHMTAARLLMDITLIAAPRAGLLG